MKADHSIHGGWGHHIDWFPSDQFKDWNGEVKNFRVCGHLPVKPKVGETLIGEFSKSFIKFRFVKVEYQNDPPDMFFADVVPIEQEVKG